MLFLLFTSTFVLASGFSVGNSFMRPMEPMMMRSEGSTDSNKLNANRVALTASLSLLLSLSMPMNPTYADAGLLTTTVRGESSSSSKSSGSIKDILRDFNKASTGSTSSASSASSVKPFTEETVPSSAVETIAASEQPVTKQPSAPIKQTITAPQGITVIPLPELPPFSLTDTYKSFLSDWRYPAVIITVVMAVDIILHSQESREAVSKKDELIARLKQSVEELEGDNAANDKLLQDLAATSQDLSRQVESLTSELKESQSRLDALSSTSQSLLSTTKTLEDSTGKDLVVALKRVEVLAEENAALKSSSAEVASRASLAALLQSREEAVVRSVKSFLQREGYISQGVANMLIAGTIPSILSGTLTRGAAVAEAVDELKARVSALTAELEEAALAKRKLQTAVSGTALLKAKTERLEAELESLKSRTQVPVVSVASAEKDKEWQQKLENSKALVAKLHDQLAAAHLAEVKAAAKSEEHAAKVAALEVQLSSLKVNDQVNVQTAADLQTMSKQLDKVMQSEQVLRKQLEAKEAELAAAQAVVATRKATPVTSRGAAGSKDMEDYLQQLKTENEELKSRLLASDEQMMELTNVMQKKVDNAKEMAKMLNAQMLAKTSEFEKREAKMLVQLEEAKVRKPEVVEAPVTVAAPGEEGVEVAEGKSKPVKKLKLLKERVDEEAPVVVAKASSVSSSVENTMLQSTLEELKGTKPYMLRKKTKAAIQEIAALLQLKDASGKLLDPYSLGKLELLQLIEAVVY